MKQEAKKRIEELTDRFRRNLDVYKNGSYNETQVRREFIDPLFEILGWDVANKAGYAEQYKDVVHEDSIKVGVSLKAPDYSFRIGGQRKFFLEAKKPQVKIKEDVGPAYQLRRYAWSAKLPLSIVTDFEEFAVYDCRTKPDPKDKVSLGRIAYYTYDQYLEKFDEIYETFSKEAMFHVTKIQTLDFPNLQDYVMEHSYDVARSSLDDGGWSLSGGEEEAILAKIKAAGVPLSEYVEGKIYYGIKTGLNEAFVIDSATRTRLIAEDPKSEEVIKPFLVGRDVKRYYINDEERYLIFTKRGTDINKYPAIERHLSQFKDQLMPKPRNWKGPNWKGRKSGSYKWYEIQDAVDYYKEFEEPKIMYLVFQVKPAFTIDVSGMYGNNAIWIIPGADKYLLGILNSKLGWLLISKFCTEIQNGYQLIFKYLGNIPIRTIDFKNTTDKTLHDKMVSLVDRMLDLNKKLQTAKIAHEKELLERQIKITDDQIDRLVYELYGLTEEEIGVVEGKEK